MTHGLLCCQTVASPHLQQPENEILCSLRHTAPGLLREIDIPLYDLSIKLVQDVMKKGQRATQNHVRDHAHSPDVDLTTVLLLLDHFWSEIEV
jgi:hypothetical protein